MRFADTLLRRGHLSEEALADAYLTGNRPAHLDRCEICAERALDLSRWLDDVRATGVAAADEAFPAERLVAQQTQIMRRLEQMDRPARVIAFPGQSRYGQLETGSRGIRPAWVAVAAAAGLVLGVFGTQITSRFAQPSGAAVAPVQVDQAGLPNIQTASYELPTASLMELDEADRPIIPSVEALEGMTPKAIQASQHVVLRGRSGS